jgi:O-methyltransferase
MVFGAIKSSVRNILRQRGIDVVSYGGDFSDLDKDIIRQVEPYTLTTHPRIFSMIETVRHVQRNSLEGAFVECGVWRGGSMMAVALAINALKLEPRDLYLYDTYEGMTPPSEKDVLNSDPTMTADEMLTAKTKGSTGNIWCDASLEDVQANMAITGYPEKLIHYVKGPVEETIPATIPDKIAVLRLDTDWYESTKHELEHLFPRVVRGGLIVIDDYGFWKGAREAVDEYLGTLDHAPFLARIDSTGRICVKM